MPIPPPVARTRAVPDGAGAGPCAAAAPSRRTLLRAAALAPGMTLLASCDDLTPPAGERAGRTSGPDGEAPLPPDAEILRSVRDRVSGHLAELRRLEGKGARAARSTLRPLWEEQESTLTEMLRLMGVPSAAPADDDSAATAADDAVATTDGAAATASPGPSRGSLGKTLRSTLPQVVAQAAGSTPTNRALLVSLAAQQAWAATHLGARVEWAPLVGPRGPAAVQLLAATRPAVFGLEVVAARSAFDERAAYEAVLTALSAVSRQLTDLAGDTAPPAPLGYDLPGTLEESADRRRLARELVADLVPAALAAAAVPQDDVEQLTSVVRLVAEPSGWLTELGADPTPFPGLHRP